MRCIVLLSLVIVVAGCKAHSQAASGVNDASIPVQNSEIMQGPRVDLMCQGSRSGTNIDLHIVENGQVQPSVIPNEVPSVFMEALTNNQFYIREFTINGTASHDRNDSGASVNGELFENRKMYGSLGFTEPAEGFQRFGIYGDYENFSFPAITINYSSFGENNRLQLYYRGSGGATNFPLACRGTMPDLPDMRTAQPHVEPYHREFACDVARRGQIEAVQFSFQVRNLHNPRIMQPLVQGDDFSDYPQWVVGNIDEHQINIFNSGDSGLSYGGTGNRMSLELLGDEDGVNTASLSFDYPQQDTTQVSGRFYYRPSDSGTLWSDVTCTVNPFEL